MISHGKHRVEKDTCGATIWIRSVEGIRLKLFMSLAMTVPDHSLV